MAEALIGGLISKGVFEAGSIIACAPSEKTRNHVAGTYGIEMFATAAEVTARSDLLVLAVKPKHVLGVLSEEGVEIGAGKTLISIVAGLTIDALKWAAYTYVVAALGSLATLFYYIGLARRD